MITLASNELPVDYSEVLEILHKMNEDAERQAWPAKANAWIQAFSRFKSIRQQIGLPQDQDDLNVYKAVLTDVEQQGQLLLLVAKSLDVDWSEVEIGEANFRAAVAEMEQDEEAARSGLLLQDQPEIASLFA